MKQKIALVSLALIGFVCVFSGSAWANRDHRPGHYVDQRYARHGGDFGPSHGWHRGPGHHGKRWHRGPWHHPRHPWPAHRAVGKHVYHHYDRDDRYAVAGSVSDPFFSFSFGISGSR